MAEHRVDEDGYCVVSDLRPVDCAGCRGHTVSVDEERIHEGRVTGGLFG